VKSRGVTVDNSNFEGEKLWVRKWVLAGIPPDQGIGAGGALATQKSRCGQRFISGSHHLDKWPVRKGAKKWAHSIEQAQIF
jgi:hypothetical protein